jgi:delta-1-pyrroline-5-carboxylate synthetase
VITRPGEQGLALGRLAFLIEQIATLAKRGHEVLFVTSGAVAFGKQLLSEQVRLLRALMLSRQDDHDTRFASH